MNPDRWLTFKVEIPSASGEPGRSLNALIPSVLVDLGARGVVEEPDGFIAYLLPPEDLEGFLDTVRRTLTTEIGRNRFGFEWWWQPQKEWTEVWKRGLEPRRVGNRFVISPSWCDPVVGPDDILIVIDPQMAFGTAEHPTTRGCLRLLEKVVQPGDEIMDIGAGSGILSIAAVKLGAEVVEAFEADSLAEGAALENIGRNDTEDQIVYRVRSVTSRDLEELGSGWGERQEGKCGGVLAGVVANIESGILTSLLPGLAAILSSGRWLILSGLLADQEADLRTVATTHGFDFVEPDREEEWVALRFVKA